MLTAEYGGSGGRPIESGLVVEEPDIEIGAGVSSKAISRRMQTDKSGRHGPKSSHDDHNEGDGQQQQQQRWRGSGSRDGAGRGGRGDREWENPNQMPPGQGAGSVFPFGFGMGMNGMPMFPPGFSFPAPPGQ